MELLPVEIKEKIFGFLRSSSVQNVISRVCVQWEEISSRILFSRVEKIVRTLRDETLMEIRSRLHPSIQNDDIQLLIEYERSVLSSKFEIEQRNLSSWGFDDFMRKIWEARGCDCVEVDLCLVRAIHFMPCHQLMLVQIPERIAFYSMKGLQRIAVETSKSTDDNLKEYTTSVKGSSLKNIWIDNNTHTAVSMYKDLVVSQETTRALILFKVFEVDHVLQTVVLENIRRIFLPLWSCAVLMLENKVYTLFTTGSIGVWKMSEDDISVSGNTCASTDIIRTMRVSRMYRLNNLVLVKIVSDYDPPVSWTIFDSNCNDEGFKLHTCPLLDLVNTNFMDAGEDCVEVLDVVLSLNAIVVHCKVKNSDGRSLNVGKLIAKRMSRTPVLEDFIVPMQFSQLFYVPNKALMQNLTLRSTLVFTGSMTMHFVPQMINGGDDSTELNFVSESRYPVVSFIGLQKSSKSHKKRPKNALQVISIELMNL